MSRRNSSSRRRNYGRRLHEVNERRSTRDPVVVDWLSEADEASDAGGAATAGRFDAAHRDAGFGRFDSGRLREARGGGLA
jgi:hypothetical protein